MTRRYERSLVVGKFAPLHRGHELLIERALAQSDEVIVLSYSKPEMAGCGPDERSRWLESLFPSTRRLVLHDRTSVGLTIPHNDAPASEHRRFVATVCLDLLGTSVQAVFTSETYGDGFAAALTDHFRKRHGVVDEVTHELVDLGRTRVPVSGTLIRSDVHRYRAFLSPVVYASFVERVCLLGGESSGKTTLAETLAKVFETTWAAEYGRTLWDEKDGQLEEGDMLQIAERQIQLEQAAACGANRWIFCDSSPLTTLLYALDLFDKADARLEALAGRTYRHTLLCAPDFAFVQDGTRRDSAFRERQHEWYVRELDRRNVPFHLVSGPLDDRVAQVMNLLGLR